MPSERVFDHVLHRHVHHGDRVISIIIIIIIGTSTIIAGVVVLYVYGRNGEISTKPLTDCLHENIYYVLSHIYYLLFVSTNTAAIFSRTNFA